MSIKKALDSLSDQLLKPVNKSAIILLGFYTVAWGLWVLCPFWDVFTTAPLYSAMMGFIPSEVFWGSTAVGCGLATVYGVIRHSYNSLLIGAGAVGWHWFIIGIFYFIGDWANTGGLTSIFLALYAVYIYLNIKVNHHRYDEPMDQILH